MRVAVDAMGGDHAPREIVRGALDAARRFPWIERIILVGDEAAIRRDIPRLGSLPASIAIQHAGEVIGMNEPPALSVRRKRDASICRAVDLVKRGEAEAVFSAGNTGAAVAASMLKLRTLEGVDRPAIATVFPSPEKPFVLLDAGATTDCTPQQLVQFAVMGEVYSREILRVEKPVVALLSIGQEDSKGNTTTKEAFALLEQSPLNFSGNIESHDLFKGQADVVVCDGFVGNVVLKTSESVAHTVGSWLKRECRRHPVWLLGALLLSGAYRRIKRQSDPAVYGGAPLLGTNGITIVGHGSSSMRAVRNAIRVAAESVRNGVNPRIVEAIQAVGV